MTKIAAVTGATGFVGTHLVRDLIAQGFQVRALTRRPQPPTDNITWIEGDLDNLPALGKLIKTADVLFHVAGLVKARQPQEFDRVNSLSVQTLLTVIHKSTAQPHFILLSSLAARERHLSSYAQSKRRGEEILIDQAQDLPWTILRPPGIYGPHDMETLKIFKAVTCRITPLPGGANNRASWIYAPDLARAMIAVAQNQACFGQILDVDDGTPEGYSNQDMYETAANILDIRAFQVVIPKFILKFIAHINVLFSTLFGYTPMVTPDKVNELCYPDWICRGPHVMRMTNWKPETDLKQGFEKTLKWYKDHNLV
ncbi:MAG: hypothetical protein COB54_07775 [Alphaproteobacteria bacterium]|nr:MAG: hypothetical protein COB54_07775 [Alphaproteobacteria bacterium]